MIDRALKEKEVPSDEMKMRGMLGKLRYKNAGVFRAALEKSLREDGVKVL
ncbi:MAG: hypothetical protein KAU50_08700 [Candidatus Marinimicrobia bacterium]|nr:hypothetical protein [Candidatus Neomarinimicrobiota bacterium]